jgi:predicted ATPase
MPTSLTAFRVVGLHDRKTIDVKIEQNKLILVGENGSGKSTLANLIYYFLSKQWLRLREYRFRTLEADLDGKIISLSSEQLDEHVHGGDEAEHFVPRVLSQRWNAIIRRLEPGRLERLGEDTRLLRMLANEAGVPVSAARDLVAFARHQPPRKPTAVDEVEEQITGAISEVFLYLPTYRRIEHDLQSIFRGGSVDIDDLRRSVVPIGSDAYVELIHFGMEDVNQTIQARMNQLKESLRTGLNKLTGAYLHEVIQGVYRDVNLEDLKAVDLPTLDPILARIPDETLPQADKIVLKEKVSSIAGRSYDPRDNVIAHFLLKLLTLYKEQQASERSVRKFVDVCNGYLTGKMLIYDEAKYDIVIELTTDDLLQAGSRKDAEKLELRMLSSGEKQIVSLFSQIYLAEGRKFFVVIDEPELSLSVVWQRRFLPDILASERCNGLVAVTHSPFIYDNNLVRHVRSLPELTVPYNVVR